ncbi:hypothetical protein B0H34DRAFT_640116, partial [Crassisporium funariophilum]
LYVFAPVTVFADIITTIFIRTPYRTAVYLLDALFPLYVLCGVACITGGVLGLLGRMLCRVLVNAVQAEDYAPNMTQRDSSKAVKAEQEDVNTKGKGKKVERVKFES